MVDLTSLLKYAETEKASDVHIIVGASPKIRVHGRLKSTNYPKLTPSDTLEAFLSIVNPAQRDRFESAGEIDLSVSIPGAGRFRVNAYKQRGSISLTFRLVDMQIPDPSELMIPQSVLNLCEKKKGLVIISGPSGSGKSTLLASMIDKINEVREANIITLEDPIEYLHSHKTSVVNQREIGFDTESYAAGLTAALKEDADVIQIGELTDSRIAAEVFRAAQTGRLIFTSMYTTGIVETIEAVIGLFPEYQQEMARGHLASCLRAVITRQLCEGKDGTTRVPAYGILFMNNSIREKIRKGRYEDIMEDVVNNRDKGMITMDESLLELYRSELIDHATAIALSQDSEHMEESLSLV